MALVTTAEQPLAVIASMHAGECAGESAGEAAEASNGAHEQQCAREEASPPRSQHRSTEEVATPLSAVKCKGAGPGVSPRVGRNVSPSVASDSSTALLCEDASSGASSTKSPSMASLDTLGSL